jgi:choline dehydrogenase-like flavoprotein
MLYKNLGKIDSATRVINAPLAVRPAHEGDDLDFQKFATPGPILSIAERQKMLAQESKGSPLRIMTDCTVTKIVQQDNKRALALETTQGVVSIGDAKLILAMGTLPPTTLVLNSFPQVKGAGKHFTAHFISAVIARVPKKDYPFQNELEDLELAAIYLAGMDKRTKGQYHIQLTALYDKDPIKNAQTALRHMPDVVATASMEQLLTSKDHVVFVCAVLGEIDFDNPQNWFLKNGDSDPTTNVTLQVVESKNDSVTWDTMDEGTFQALERVLSPNGKAAVEYWHQSTKNYDDDRRTGSWKKERPSVEQIRVPGLVHEGSTLWIGNYEDDDSPVGLDYRPRGVENVYVTGGSLWPRSGSWNPTMTMVALSQHLADLLKK